MKRLTAQEIEAIRKRTEKATSGNRLTDMGAFEASAIVLTEDVPKLLAEVERLKTGIDHVIFLLANENIEDSRIVSEIHCELIRVYNGDKIEPHPFNTEWRL